MFSLTNMQISLCLVRDFTWIWKENGADLFDLLPQSSESLSLVFFLKLLCGFLQTSTVSIQIFHRLPAEFRIPVHHVNVEEHRATGVGDVCAVDPPVPAPRQALRRNITECDN